MKILSINLWYENYKNKTLAQLSSFRFYGYETYVATVKVTRNCITPVIMKVDDEYESIIYEKECLKSTPSGYKKAFNYIFEYANNEGFDIIYIRRLMSKLFYASSTIKKYGNSIPIVYEIPTYPLDTNETFLYRLRDTLEMKQYAKLSKYIALTTAILRENISLAPNWMSFHNGIDIRNYTITPIPELNNEVRFLAVANMADWHRYERMLYAIKSYDGDYNIKLTVIAPSNGSYDNFKSKVNELRLSDQVTCYGKMTLKEITDIAKSYHIGVGQLSYKCDCSSQINTLKTKDYCAMGLPFFTSCQDTSFDMDYPYAYVFKDMDVDINLSKIINWYEEIYKNPKYRQEMFDYAKENLQFNGYVKDILAKINK